MTSPQQQRPDAGQTDAEAPTDPRGDATPVRLSRIERIAGRRLAQTKATVPEIVVQVVVDMAPAVALRERLRAEAPEGAPLPSYNDMVVRACALALREHPRVNASWADDELIQHGRVNVGVAVAAGTSLVVPTVFDADRLSLAALAAETRRLAGAVRDGAITPAELEGGTFTVSNLGMYGVETFTAILFAPQVAILAVGAIEEPDARERRPLRLALTCDHRALAGAPAAAFLASVRERLEAPEGLVEAPA